MSEGCTGPSHLGVERRPSSRRFVRERAALLGRRELDDRGLRRDVEFECRVGGPCVGVESLSGFHDLACEFCALVGDFRSKGDAHGIPLDVDLRPRRIRVSCEHRAGCFLLVRKLGAPRPGFVVQRLTGFRQLSPQRIAGAGHIPVQVGTGCGHEGFEGGGGRLYVTIEVGASLLDVAREIAPLFRVEAVEVRSAPLGVPRQLGGVFPGLVDLPQRDRAHFGGIAIRFGTHRGGLPFCRGARLGGFGGNRTADSRGIPRGLLRNLFRSESRAPVDFVGFFSCSLEAAVGLLLCVRRKRFSAFHGVDSQSMHLVLGARTHSFGVDIGLADETGGLLFGETQHVLELGPQPAVRGTPRLLDL